MRKVSALAVALLVGMVLASGAVAIGDGVASASDRGAASFSQLGHVTNISAVQRTAKGFVIVAGTTGEINANRLPVTARASVRTGASCSRSMMRCRRT